MKSEVEIENMIMSIGGSPCSSFGRHVLYWVLERASQDPSRSTTEYSQPQTKEELDEWYPKQI